MEARKMLRIGDFHQEINGPKGSRDKRKHALAPDVDFACNATVGKDFMEPKFTQCKLTVVGMSSEVFHAVESLTKAS